MNKKLTILSVSLLALLTTICLAPPGRGGRGRGMGGGRGRGGMMVGRGGFRGRGGWRGRGWGPRPRLGPWPLVSWPTVRTRLG